MYEKFARLLKQKGVTAYKVSKETGISQSTFSDWKNGRSKPKREKQRMLEDYFNVPIGYFEMESGIKESFYVSDEEKLIVEAYRSLGESERDMVKRSLGIDDVRESAAREMQKYCTPTANFKAE